MRKVNVNLIKKAIKELCLKANVELRPDVLKALKLALNKEKNRPKRVVQAIIGNAKVAKNSRLAICQDTGLVEVFLQIGQDVRLLGGNLSNAINDGVRGAYKIGFFRKSVVSDPLVRKNTNTNTPAVMYTEIVPGKKIKITVAPKGFGSENKSAVKMLLPTANDSEIEDFVLDVVKSAGPEACPPWHRWHNG